jgi:hypothetical protein
MTSTYEKIATNTLGSATATVTFSTISGAYTDLVLIMNYGQTSGNNSTKMRFNSDTGTNYSTTILSGNGTTAASSRESTVAQMTINDIGASSTLTTNAIVNIQNYANTTTYKTAITRGNTASAGTCTDVCLWRSTSAITSIDLFLAASTFLSGSTFTLYGIKAA